MKLLCQRRVTAFGPFVVLLGLLSASGARAGELFVTGPLSNTIGAYTTSGGTVNAALISGLNIPLGIAVVGSDLYVTNFGDGTVATGTIGEYTTSGATVNAALISGLRDPAGIAVDGSHLFVANQLGPVNQLGTIGEYTTSGATVDAPLISFSFEEPTGLAMGPSVPEPSTWAMMLLGFVGLGYAGFRRARGNATRAA
jgi:hypothetical protein